LRAREVNRELVVAACWRISGLGMLRDFKIVTRHLLNDLEKTVLEFQST
jgi:hypothetical protein